MGELFNSLSKEPAPKGDGFQVGDVLTASWGYDQTNAFFYKVTKRTPKTVSFVRLGAKVVDERLVPTDTPYGVGGTDQKVYKSRRIKKDWDGTGRVRVSDWSDAWPWDGTGQYDTRAAGLPGH